MENKGKDLKSLHSGDLANLLYIYNVKSIFSFKESPFFLAFFFTGAIVVARIVTKNEVLPFLNMVCELGLSLLPNLLGFTLAGLTIIVAFGNTSYLASLSVIKDKGNNLYTPSFFQKIIAVFTWSVLLQALVLCLAFCINLVSALNIALRPEWAIIINYFFLALFLLLFSYALFLVPKTILNIFTFGQGHHFKSVVEKEIESKKKLRIKNRLLNRNTCN